MKNFARSAAPARAGVVSSIFLFFFLFSAAWAAAAPTAVIECDAPCEGDEGVTLSFHGDSSTPAPLSYLWDMGDGSPYFISPNVEHTFKRAMPYSANPNNAGYTVTLTVTDNYDATDQDFRLVKIYNVTPTPVAYGFDILGAKQYSEVTVFINQMYTFGGEESHDASSAVGTTSGITQWAWDWDWDGDPAHFSADNNNATYNFATWNAVGDYTVGLRVTDDDGYPETAARPSTAYAALTVHVIPLGPWARIGVPSVPFNEGQTITLEDESLSSNQPLVKWEWIFDYDGDPESFDEPADIDYVYENHVSPNDPTRHGVHAFDDARPYRVGLKVTDAIDRTNVTSIIVEPQNVLPTCDLAVRDPNTLALLSPPYVTDEGVPLRFDATASRAEPGYITGYQWDWNYTGIPNWGMDYGGAYDHSWNEDSAHKVPPGTYRVRVRAIDDDSEQDHPSDAVCMVEVTVADVPPVAEISGNAVLGEGQQGEFTVADVGGNTDPVVMIEWDLSYAEADGFQADVLTTTGSLMWTLQYSWDEIDSFTIAARITDDDGSPSMATLDVEIIDSPPIAKITPYNGESPMDVQMVGGKPTLFTSENVAIRLDAGQSQVGPSDRIVRLRWDEVMEDGEFHADSDWDLSSTCAAGSCSRIEWMSCGVAGDCAGGVGELPYFAPDDGSSQVAVCVEDNDHPGLCDSTTDPDSSWIYVLHIEAENAAPYFDKTGFPSERQDVVTEGDPYSYQAPVIDARDDVITCHCDDAVIPPGMSCVTNTAEKTCILYWEPGQDDVNCGDWPPPHSVSVWVEDDDGGVSAPWDWTILVTNENDCPQITGISGPTTVRAGEAWSNSVTKDDPDERCGDSWDYSLENKPAGMSINTFGEISWTPTEAQISPDPYNFKVCVTDSAGCKVCRDHSVQVQNPDQSPVCEQDDVDALPGLVCQTAIVTENPGNTGNDGLTYHWTFESGPEAVCLDPDTASESPDDPAICFAATAVGDYELSLQLENEYYRGESCYGELHVVNLAPGAVVGPSRNYLTGTTGVRLDGSRSGDYNAGDFLTFSWAGPDGAIAAADLTVAKPEINPLFEAGFHDFQLMVSDGELSSDPASVTIGFLDTTNPAQPDTLPWAHIAEVPSATEYSEVILDGSKSSARKPNLDLSYTWRQIMDEDRPADVVLTTTGESPFRARFTPDRPGIYRFGLVVSADDGEVVRQSREFIRAVYVDAQDNVKPVADAGDDILESIFTRCDSPVTDYVRVELNGTNSEDPPPGGGMDLSYRWRQVEGVPVALHDDDTARPYFYAFEPGLSVFELTVSDGVLESLPDRVAVSISIKGNDSPSAVIGGMSAQGVLSAQPGESVTLDATGSNNFGEDDELFFEWYQRFGPPVVLSDWADDLVEFRPDVTGVAYGFRLTVWDEHGNPSLPVDLTVNVLAEFNQAPECKAAKDYITVTVGDTVVLDGTPTTDEDEGDDTPENPLQIQWRLIPEDSVVDSVELTPDENEPKIARFVPDTAGDYAFLLSAFDGKEYCQPEARVNVTVSGNSQPQAKARVEGEACVGSTVQLDGSLSSDPDGHELSYRWTVVKELSSLSILPQDLSPSDTDRRPTFYAYDAGEVVFELVVSDGLPGGESEPARAPVLVKNCNADGDENTDGDTGNTCRDSDNDGYYTGGADCQPADCNDTNPNLTTNCEDPDGDGGGGGGGCRTGTRSAFSAWFAWLGLLFLAGLRRRERKSARAK